MIWKKKKTENVSEQEPEPAEKPKKFTLKRPVIHGRRVIVICVLAVILALVVVVGVSYNKKIGIFSEKLQTTFFHLYSEKITNTQTIRLVVLSDLHNAEFGEDNSELIEKVQKLSPDLILLAGDMVDKNSDNTEIVLSLCAQLQEIAPVYYGLGNHEGTMMYVNGNRIDSDLRAEGIKVLINDSENVTVKGTTLSIGSVATSLADFDEYSAPFVEQFEQKDTLKILIAHFPDLFYEKLADVNVDLAVAGHYHGGQVQLPLVGGVYSVDNGLFPEYCNGMFSLTNGHLFVTRGLGNSHRFPRVNNRPEIAVIDINARKDGTVVGTTDES